MNNHGRGHHSYWGRSQGEEQPDRVPSPGFTPRGFRHFRQNVDCICGGCSHHTGIPPGIMTYGNVPSAIYVPPYQLIPYYAVNPFAYPPMPSVQRPPPPATPIPSMLHFGCDAGDAIRRQLQPPLVPSPVSNRRPTVGGERLDSGNVTDCTGGRPFLDTLMVLSDSMEGPPTLMPMRFIQSAVRANQTMFELHCSAENMELLKRMFREADTRGRDRTLDFSRCPAHGDHGI